jgi:hypothetical protein
MCYHPAGRHQAAQKRTSLMERMYYSISISFRQAGKEKKVKIYFRIPGFLEIIFESKPRSPLEKDKFYVLAGISALAIPFLTMLLWEVWR